MEKAKNAKDLPKYKKKIDESVFSRVYVDYSGKKPKISFDVPQHERQRKNVMNEGSSMVVIISIALSLYLSIFLVLLLDTSLQRQDIVACHVHDSDSTYISTFGPIENSTQVKSFDIECTDIQNKTSNASILFSHSSANIFGKNIEITSISNLKEGVYIDGKDRLFQLYFLSFFMILIVMLSALFPLRKWIGRKMLQNDGPNVKPKYKWVFKAGDIIKRDGKWICDIPLFDNMVLDYDTKDDFQKYLLEVKVIDLPVLVLPKKRLFKRKSNKTKKSIKHWKAEFIFKKRPLNGEMVCKFD